MPEELETVLRLVAEGRLTPEEAAPIIEALSRAERAERDTDLDDLDGLGTRVERTVRRANRHAARANRHADRAFARAEERIAAAGEGGRPGGRQLRIKVTERGRQVVNLRIPIGFVESALRFVPGLAGDQAQRIRDAVRAGAVGPILDVEDPDGAGGVLISVE
jgi:hypothetical protein